MTEWWNWFSETFNEWSGGKKSASQYAVTFGFNQATVSAWLNKTRGAPKTQRIIKQFIDLYGDKDPRVYEALGMPRPEKNQLKPSPETISILEAESKLFLEELWAEIDRKGLNLESPEAKEIANKMLDSFILKVKSKL